MKKNRWCTVSICGFEPHKDDIPTLLKLTVLLKVTYFTNYNIDPIVDKIFHGCSVGLLRVTHWLLIFIYGTFTFLFIKWGLPLFPFCDRRAVSCYVTIIWMGPRSHAAGKCSKPQRNL